MNPETAQALFANLPAILTAIGVIFIGVLGYIERRAAINRELAKIQRDAVAAIKVEQVATATKEAARQVEAVKETLVANTETTGNKLNSIHTLVNSQHGTALKALAAALRAVADLNPTVGSLAAAEEAQKASDEHETAQKRVDAEAVTKIVAVGFEEALPDGEIKENP